MHNIPADPLNEKDSCAGIVSQRVSLFLPSSLPLSDWSVHRINFFFLACVTIIMLLR